MMSKHIGSHFDDFLEEEDLLAEAEAAATKRVIAWQIENMMRGGKPGHPRFSRLSQPFRGRPGIRIC